MMINSFFSLCIRPHKINFTVYNGSTNKRMHFTPKFVTLLFSVPNMIATPHYLFLFIELVIYQDLARLIRVRVNRLCILL